MRRTTGIPDSSMTMTDSDSELAGMRSDTSGTASAPVRTVPVHRMVATTWQTGDDRVAVEEPLEISLVWPTSAATVRETELSSPRNIAVTMRTPGNDPELAVGFLYTEGILQSPDEIMEVIVAADSVNRLTIVLRKQPQLDAIHLERNFYMTSSCGVCGKASIEAIRVRAQFAAPAAGFAISAARLLQLPTELQAQQAVFHGTGSIHAAALFTEGGALSRVYEDVGRHNAVDKLIGAALLNRRLPLTDSGLLVSGRASFELVQKARMAGCVMLAAVGAPSSLAIDLAWDADMTLVGFLRDGRFNVYTGPARVINL